MSSVKEDKKMAKKKSVTPRKAAKSGKIELALILGAIVVIVWSLYQSIFKSVTPGAWFWIALVFLAIRWIVVGGIFGKSYTYFVKKLFKPLGEKIKKWREEHEDDEDEYEDVDVDDDGDDDDDTVDMAAFGFTRVETVIDGVTVTLDKPDDLLLSNAKDNAWTAISKKKPDGQIVYAVVERPKLVPAKLKADEEVGPLNVVKKKKPAAKPVDAGDKALAGKLLAKGCAPADLVKKVADAKALIATGLFTEDEAIAHVVTK